MALVGDSYEYHDKSFHDLTVPIAEVEELHSGCRWAEGPVWFADQNLLLWNDIPNNRTLRLLPSGAVDVFAPASGYANGMTRDRQGRLIRCSHGKRALERLEPDGGFSAIATMHDGKRLNSPNDVVVKSDGSVWFTDPDYGILSDYEGYRAPREQAGCFVYRLDPASGAVKAVATDFAKPNGLAFSPDETKLYVADSGLSHDPQGPHHIRVFDVTEGGLRGGKVFAEIDPGVPDGLRVDERGNVWVSCQNGVICLSPEGKSLGKIRIPQMVSNLCFGGERRNRLFITATKSLYAVFVGVSGAQRP